jgi:hypothetical protein
MSEPARPVLVVGCPRSGTSPFARWLHACGLETVSDARRDPRSPSGYFEYLPMLMFHRALERLPRGADHRITTEPYLTAARLEHPFVARTFELGFEPLLDDQVDFLKYPQLALSLDFLLARFPDAHVVGLWRSPVSTFRSLVSKEFPIEMRPASAVKAVLLWSVYAHHLVAAKRACPERVTLVEVDGFFADEASGPALLERLGRPGSHAAPIAGTIDQGLWGRPSSLPWRAGHASVAALCRLFARRLGPQREPLADQRRWLAELRDLTDVGARRPG